MPLAAALSHSGLTTWPPSPRTLYAPRPSPATGAPSKAAQAALTKALTYPPVTSSPTTGNQSGNQYLGATPRNQFLPAPPLRGRNWCGELVAAGELPVPTKPMPTSSKRLCPGCGAWIKGRCPTCSPAWTTGRRTKRKYPTSHRRWRTLRLQILRRDPVCQVCHVNLSTQADHIVPVEEGGPELDPRNLQGICDPCHQAKTRLESRRGKGR